MEIVNFERGTGRIGSSPTLPKILRTDWKPPRCPAVMRIIAAAVILLICLLIDYYVYRNWRPFAYRRLAWTLPVYRAMMIGLPILLMGYSMVWVLWGIDPRFLRQVVTGVWAIWYVPKLPIVLVLAVKDLMRFIVWLFGWFQARFKVEEDNPQAADLSDLPKISRSEFLRQVGWTTAGVPFAIVGYGVFKGLYDFQVRNITVRIPGLPRALDGLRIAQLSDLHAGSHFSERPMQEVISLVMQQRPDLIALTGDFVNNDHREMPLILPALDQLQAPLGVFGVRGNHDHYANVRQVSELIRAAGVDLLVNEARTLAIDGARLHILGTDNTGFRQNFGDLPRAISQVDRNGDDAHILLAHDPTFWDSHVRQLAPEIDLTLSGHTHGGQLGFEMGPLRWSLAQVMYERWAGLYRENGDDRTQQLYINRGIGTVGPPIRLGVRPEITILTLSRGADTA
jgi:uncharacterized protein